MASFSIQELLGLGKDSSANSTNKSKAIIESEQAAARNNKPPSAVPLTVGAEPEAESHEIDVETLDEDSNAELVTVEVQRTVHTTSSVSRTSATSRKRKRSKQAEESDVGKSQIIVTCS